MISLELLGESLKNKEQLTWQIRTQWIGKDPLLVPVDLHVGIGIKIPSSFGSIKKRQAINQLIVPNDNFNIFKALDFYSNLLENILVLNKNQFYKTSIQKFYSSSPKVVIHLLPQINESNNRTTEGIL